MAVNDFYRLRMQFVGVATGLTAECGFAFMQSTAPVLGTPEEDLVDSFRTEVEANVLAMTGEDYQLVRYAVQTLPANDLIYELAITPPIVGGGAGDQLPPQIAGLLTYKTARLDRSGRGRTFLPPVAEVHNARNPNTTYRTLGANLIISLQAMADGGVTNGDWPQAVWSTKELEGNIITQWVLSLKWATQRGRTK